MNRRVLTVVSPAILPAVQTAADQVTAELVIVDPARASEALASGEYALAMLDLLVPGGADLVRSLRQVAPDLPLVVFAAWWDRPSEAVLVDARVVAAIYRPVDAAAVTEVLGTLLPEPDAAGEVRWKVLVVDDDDVGLKLIRLRLTAAGFDVVTARNGELGLAAAKAHHPDAIVCDVLMPYLDGFGFTQRIRQDPELRAVPVILISANYIGRASKKLGEDCGANHYLERTATLREVVDALGELQRERLTLVPDRAPVVDEDRVERARNTQIDRLIRVNAVLGRMRALSDTALAILGATASSIARRSDRHAIHGHILQLCVDSGAIVLAALYLRGPEGKLRVEGAAGEVFIRDRAVPAPASVEALLASVSAECEVIALPGSMLAEAPTRGFLAETRTASALVVPLRVAGRDLGVLLLGSDLNDIASPDWRTFGRTLSSQLALSLALLGKLQPTDS